MKNRLLVLLILYSLFHLGYSIWTYNPIRIPSISGDFQASYVEALHWRQTGEFKLMASTNVPYPPFFYWWIFPLTFFPYFWVSTGLYLAQFIFFAWALALLIRAAAPDDLIRPSEYVMAVLLAVNFQPFLETLSQHKVEGLEFFLLSAAILAFKKGRDLQTGALIFVAAAMKYLPGILLLYFLIKREFRVLLGFLLAGVLCLTTFAIFFGARTAWDLGIMQTLWLAVNRLPESNQPTANFEWQSLSEVVNRFFAQPVPDLGKVLFFSQAIPSARPAAAIGVGLILKAILVGGFPYLIRHRYSLEQREKNWPLILCEISLTFVMVPVMVQALRLHYGILLFPAFVTTGVLLLRQPDQFRLSEKILFGASYALSGMLIPGGLLNRLPPLPFWGGLYSRLYAWWSLPFYGYMLLGAAVLLRHKRLRDAVL